MQKYSVSNDPEDRRVVRRWRFAVLALYGTIASVLLLLSAVFDNSTQLADNSERPIARVAASR